MVKPIIAIDIDDVLSANAEGFTAFSNARWGTRLTPQDYSENWAEMWGIDHAETNKRSLELHASGVIGNYRHDDQAIPVLEELTRKYKLVVITSRRALIDKETRTWIDKHFSGIFEAVLFSGIYDDGLSGVNYLKNKSEAMQSVGASYLIDDQIKHCLAASESGLKAILFGDYPWNQMVTLPTNVTRCKDWQAVKEYFDA